MTTTKICTERKSPNSNTEYSRVELNELAKTKLSLKSTEIKKLSKKELCQKLKISWKPKTLKKPILLSEKKVCTDKRCTKSYPNRYGKEELVEMVRTKFPTYSKTALKLRTIPKLCTMLKKPIMKCPTPYKNLSKTDTSKQISNVGSFNQTQSQKFKKPSYLPSCIQRSSLPIRQHQKKVIDYFSHHRGLIAYHTVGTGKTLTAITISQCFLDKYPNYKVYVVTPASLVQNFKNQMMDYENIKYADQYRFYSIQKFVSLFRKTELSCKNVLLIVDEAHNLKTLYKKSQPKKPGKKPTEVGINSKYIEKCARQASKCLLLTGTPITNSPKDLIPLYNMVRDDNEPRIDTKRKDLGMNEITYTEKNLLEKMKCKISIFDERSSAYYPIVKEHDIFIKMTPSYQEKYEKLLSENGLSKLAIKMFGEVDITKFYNGFRRAVNTLEDEDSPKINWVLKKIQQGRKTIVFSHFLDAGNKAIIKNLPNNIKYKYINGSLSLKERSEIVNEYNLNKIQVLFISKAGGEGLDLKGTQDIILLEPAWNLSVEEQVIGRGVRYKSHDSLPITDRKVDVYRLYMVKKWDDIFIQKHESQKGVGEIDGEDMSIDLLMRFLIQRKEKILEQFRKKLKEISIENTYCI